MALTLLDMQRAKKDNYDKGVIEVFMQEADVSKLLPIETIGTLEVTARRSNSIPTVGFRSRGEAFPAVSGSMKDTITDQVFAMGATIDIDKTDMRDKAPITDPLSDRTRDAVKGMAWTFNDYFINGDHGTDPIGFEGLKVRLATLAAGQTIYANTSSAELDIRPGTGTTADMQKFLDRIDETIYACDGHSADWCLTDADFIRTLKSCLRRLNINKDTDPLTPMAIGSGQRQTTAVKNQKPVYVYNGVKFYDMGLKANQSTKIIATETVNSQACRPAFFVKIGEPYLHGIQQYAMEVSKPFLMDDGVTYRTVIDWPVGLRHVHKAFAAKLAGARVA